MSAALLVPAVATAGSAQAIIAADSISSVAAALASDPVYVDPAAPLALSATEAGGLRSQIADTGKPIFIAVLPESAGAAPTVLNQLRSAVGRSGTYAVIVGSSFRAASTELDAGPLASQAFTDQRSAGAAAVLSAFVTLVGDAGAATSADAAAAVPSGPGSAPSASGPGSAWPLLTVLLVLLGLGGLIVARALRRSRRERERKVAQLRAVLDEDVTELGERLAAINHEDPRLGDAGRAELQSALDAFLRSRAAVTGLVDTSEVAPVTSALEDGRYQLACVQARLTGSPAPDRRPPCVIDPRHGPSSTDVPWSLDGRTVTDVPMCVACADRVARGEEVMPRRVPVGEGSAQVPYWQAGPQYAPYATGYYSSFGSVVPMMLMGGLMMSAFTPPVIIDSGYGGQPWDEGSAGYASGDYSSGGDGWFGGGDFGGGDFGGGDFGGGDF